MENWPMMDARLYDTLWREIYKSIRGLRETMMESDGTHSVRKIFADVNSLLNGFVELMKHVKEYVRARDAKDRNMTETIALLTEKLQATEGGGSAARADPASVPPAAEATNSCADQADKAEVDVDVKVSEEGHSEAYTTGAEGQLDPAGFLDTRINNPQTEARCAQKSCSQSKNKTSELHPVSASEIETRILRSGSKQPLRTAITMDTRSRTEGSCDKSLKIMQIIEKRNSDLAQNPPSRSQIRKRDRLRLSDIPLPPLAVDTPVIPCDEALWITPDEGEKRGNATPHPVEKTTSFEQVETPSRACHKQPVDLAYLDGGSEKRGSSPLTPNKDGGKKGGRDYDKERAIVDEICGMMAKYTQGFRQKAA